MPLDHKLYEFEGIRSIIDFIASINSSKNIFGAGFGENLLVFLYKISFSFVNQKTKEFDIYKGKRANSHQNQHQKYFWTN